MGPLHKFNAAVICWSGIAKFPLEMAAELIYFTTAEDFFLWLQENHLEATELWIGIYKAGSRRKGIKMREAKEEAVCFGWVDSHVKSIDDESYKIRFTPRKRGGSWSAKNILLAEEMIGQGRMQTNGFLAYQKRKTEEDGSLDPQLPVEMESILKNDVSAWEFFQQLPPSTRKISIRWINQAKRFPTREKRFQILLESCQREERIPILKQ